MLRYTECLEGYSDSVRAKFHTNFPQNVTFLPDQTGRRGKTEQKQKLQKKRRPPWSVQ